MKGAIRTILQNLDWGGDYARRKRTPGYRRDQTGERYLREHNRLKAAEKDSSYLVSMFDGFETIVRPRASQRGGEEREDRRLGKRSGAVAYGEARIRLARKTGGAWVRG